MNKDALTAPEVAEILQIAKNTVYELVKRGELDCYKVGRKMRFTYEDVQNYIKSQKESGLPLKKQLSDEIVGTEAYSAANHQEFSGPLAEQREEVFRICGHDEILDRLMWHLNQKMPSLKTERVHKGSYDALSMLYKDQVCAAASHIWDSDSNSYNKPFVRRLLPGCPAVIIQLCRRTEGFYVAEGNPKQIKSWQDLAREDICLANREEGAGTRILLDEHLTELGIDPQTIRGYSRHLPSHLAVAGLVSKGEADVGIGTMRTALGIRGISFVALQEEDYQLVIKKRDLARPAVQEILKILQSDELKEEFRYVSGYDVSDMGKIIE